MRTHGAGAGFPRGWALPLVLLALGSSPLSAQPIWFRFQDIQSILDPSKRPAATTEPIRIEQAAQTPFAASNRPESPDASLDAPITRLRLDANWLLSVPESPAPVFEFRMGDTPIRMVLAEKHWDYDFDAMHFTLVDAVTDDYARITVAFTEQEMVGTVFMAGDEFRILPVAEDTQLVFPVRDRDTFRRAVPPNLDTRLGRLEARHLQMAWYAERQPDRFDTRPDGRLHSFGDAPMNQTATTRIGKIDYLAALRTDSRGAQVIDHRTLAANIESFLNGIQHVTMIFDPVEVAIEREGIAELFNGSQDESFIHFHQLIDGIPLDARMVMVIDRNGQVRLMNGTLMRSNMLDRATGLELSEPLAIQAAIDAATALHEINWPLEVANALELHALPVDVFSTTRIWRINLTSVGCLLTYRVDVNSATGNIERLDPDVPRTMGQFYGWPPDFDMLAASCREKAAVR